MVVIVMNWIHDEANHLLSILEKPPEERFDAQHRIDRGDVSQLTWPIKLYFLSICCRAVSIYFLYIQQPT